MSRVGNKIIKIPPEVTVKIKDRQIDVKGPQGALTYEIPKGILMELNDRDLRIKRESDERNFRALHGLARALISNMIVGVSVGFTRNLVVDGVGYRVQSKGSTITMSLGYSHPIEYTVPEGITVAVDKNKIILRGYDKQLLGQVAANVRSFREVEPYKGKGIRYENEVVRRKEGKVGT